MHTALFASCLTLTTLVITMGDPARTEGYTAIAPVFSQLVTMPVPVGFVPAYEDSDDSSYINEAIPNGESLESWSQMITLTGIRGMASGDPATVAEGFANYLAGQFQGACPATFAAVALNAPQIKGAQATYAGFLGCGDNGQGQSEVMSFLILVGSSDVYSLQWAERGPGMAAVPTYDSSHWSGRLAEMTATARLCDRIEGEGPPYPSCIND